MAKRIGGMVFPGKDRNGRRKKEKGKDRKGMPKCAVRPVKPLSLGRHLSLGERLYYFFVK